MSEERTALLDSLWRDAHREGDEITRAAEAEAAQARAAAEAQAGSSRKAALDRAAAEAAPEAARIVNRARQSAAGALLVGQKAILDGLFDEVARETSPASLPEREAETALASLLQEVLSSLPPGARGELAVRPADRARAGKLLAGRDGAISVATDPSIAAGARLSLAGGRETLDNTLAARLANLREAPPLPLFAALFPPGGGPAPGKG